MKSVFRTAAGRDKVRAAYDSITAAFPFGRHAIDTSFGRTFMLTAGQENTPPVVLLHGSCSNSAFWFPEMLMLSSQFRVYAIDIIGEAGNSSEYRLDLHSDAYARWMKEVFDNLGLEKAILIGNSLGGWMALKFASICPQHVSRLVLIASAGLAPIKPKFLQESAQARQQEDPVSLDPAILGEQAIPKEVLDFINLILENYEPVPELAVFPDSSLLRLDMPVLFIGGTDDAIIDTQASASRLVRLLPAAQIRLLPGCGHMVAGAIDYFQPFIKEAPGV